MSICYASLCDGIGASHVAWHDRGKPAADGPRYRALGNSWAVPMFRWLGRRIDIVDEVLRSSRSTDYRLPVTGVQA